MGRFRGRSDAGRFRNTEQSVPQIAEPNRADGNGFGPTDGVAIPRMKSQPTMKDSTRHPVRTRNLSRRLMQIGPARSLAGTKILAPSILDLPVTLQGLRHHSDDRNQEGRKSGKQERSHSTGPVCVSFPGFLLSCLPDLNPGRRSLVFRCNGWAQCAPVWKV